jgi:uncharacterized protein YegL
MFIILEFNVIRLAIFYAFYKKLKYNSNIDCIFSIMANNESTHIELIVDRSSSMTTLFKATVSGLQEFVDIQKRTTGSENATISLITFDDVVEYPVKNVPLHSFTLDPKHIEPRGMTALYDALGMCFDKTPFMSKRTVVIITDGDDNSSVKFAPESISMQITERRKVGWVFIFLAANQDAIAAGRKLSIPAETSCTFDAEEEGATMGAIRAASNVISRGRTSDEPVGFTQLERETSAGSSHPVSTQDVFDEEEGNCMSASLRAPPLSRVTSIPRRGQTGF